MQRNKAKGNETEKLGFVLREMIRGSIPVQTVWARVKEVNWQEKTMIATPLADDLDVFDVSLGLGSLYKKPVTGSLCLIGYIQNRDTDAFLIDAEEAEEILYTSGESSFTIKEDGYIVKKGGENLRDILSDFMDEVSKIVVVYGTTIDVAAVTAIKQRLNTILIE
ncbi:hypothetical protein LS482_16215 [Sinomicrobium kalidii]|uniref:hypothetical protein n=1 Tax=Sinomicrobium kalidii TaxID=2900738 RepID=UPI001E418316|nr:hypothetical protein [Sinomicrobium kalidii]UGU15218.1 hypothetical protein LS482_16215 [Sinomicrobium kalidii]